MAYRNLIYERDNDCIFVFILERFDFLESFEPDNSDLFYPCLRLRAVNSILIIKLSIRIKIVHLQSINCKIEFIKLPDKFFE